MKSVSARSAPGHSRPMHSAPVPINVRCYSNNDMVVRRSEVRPRRNSCAATKSVLLDHLISGCEQRRRDGQSEHLGGLEVDDQFELRGSLNW